MRPWTNRYSWQKLRNPHDTTIDHDETDAGDVKDLHRAALYAKIVTAALSLIFLVLIPFPLYGTGYIFSRKFFVGWTVLVFIWSWAAALMIWGMPVWQSRMSIWSVVVGVLGRKKRIQGVDADTPVHVINESIEKKV